VISRVLEATTWNNVVTSISVRLYYTMLSRVYLSVS